MSHVIILSGASGSGKSTYARGLGAYTVSADYYFTRNGVYTFDPSKLSEAHGSCFRHFIEALQRDECVVVVDNTNTTSEEISPYVLGAQAYGATVEIRTLRGKFSNVHGCPVLSVEAQLRRIEARKLPPWWKHSEVTP